MPAPPYKPLSPEADPNINADPSDGEVDDPQDVDFDPSPRSPSYAVHPSIIKVIKGKGKTKRNQTDSQTNKETQPSKTDASKDASSRPITRSQGKAIVNLSGQIPEVVIAPYKPPAKNPPPASRHLRLLRPANSNPAGPSNKPMPPPEDESEIDELALKSGAPEPSTDEPPAKRLRTRKDSVTVAPSRSKKSNARSSSPRSSKQRRRKSRKDLEETTHEPGFPGTTCAGRSEAASKRTNKSRRCPPDLNHEALAEAVKAGSSMECVPDKTGSKCLSCQHPLCSHSLTTSETHSRIQSVAELSTFSNSRIAQATEAINRDSLHATEIQRLADSANQHLLESSHHLSLGICSMIAFYGKEGFSKLWEIPTPYKAVFMNFLAHETKHANDKYEKHHGVDEAAQVWFGLPVWDDKEHETWMAALKAYSDSNFDDIYKEDLFVGLYCEEWQEPGDGSDEGDDINVEGKVK
ncbi:hypothetical protein B0H13DRAFT_1863241 [Mycena leptocephala]|nr:hypothetical protein B0H13DRAFT_1863241 [Mycena leptocephala]